MEIARLESETLEERTQRKKEEDRKKEEARQQKEEEDRKKEEGRQQKEEEDRKKEEARQRKEEAATVAAAAAAAAAAAVGLCSHVGCLGVVVTRGVCEKHRPRCSHEGCQRIPQI